MKNYKLTIELLPKGAWDNDLSKTLSKKDWDTLRHKCYKKANHKCEICGYKTDELDAHEVWEFDVNNKTQTLMDIIGICSKCHGVKHMRNSQRLGFGENAKKHFMEVNKCSDLEFASHFTEAQMNFEEQNEILRWKIRANLEKFGGKGIEIKERNIPIIKSSYTDKELEDCKNVSSMLPRILDIDINNYNGTITVLSDKTNKIEWYGDNLLNTKFNFGQKFKTAFCVKDLKIPCLYFKLFGNGGEIISKVFYLKDYN